MNKTKLIIYPVILSLFFGIIWGALSFFDDSEDFFTWSCYFDLLFFILPGILIAFILKKENFTKPKLTISIIGGITGFIACLIGGLISLLSPSFTEAINTITKQSTSQADTIMFWAIMIIITLFIISISAALNTLSAFIISIFLTRKKKNNLGN